MPRDPLAFKKISADIVRCQIQEAVRKVVLPAYIARPPEDVGTAAAGNLKADHWRVLYKFHLPLACLSLWSAKSPLAAPDDDEMKDVLRTTMTLACAGIIMMKDKLTTSDRAMFKKLLRDLPALCVALASVLLLQSFALHPAS